MQSDSSVGLENGRPERITLPISSEMSARRGAGAPEQVEMRGVRNFGDINFPKLWGLYIRSHSVA